MKTPTDLEREELAHVYDPVKARQYYLRTRELKGRQPGKGEDTQPKRTRKEIATSARAKQRKELATSIQNLQEKYQQLKALIKKKEHEAASENRKGMAKKERAAKEKDKPKSAAEKAKAARENKKFRDKHKQKLKSDAKKEDSKSGGSSSSKAKKTDTKHSVTELKNLATKVSGQIAVAKQKLAAL